MVLFLFVIMMLNLGPRSTEQENSWLQPRMRLGPITLTIVLLIELMYMLRQSGHQPMATGTIEAKQVGIALFGPYLLGVNWRPRSDSGCSRCVSPGQRLSGRKEVNMLPLPMEHGLLLAALLFALRADRRG